MTTCQMTAGRLAAVSSERRTVEIVASAAGVDENGNSIVQSGWELARFKKNPVVCLQHDADGYTATLGLPIANAIPETVRVENDRLVMTVQFPPEGKYPVPDLVFNMVSDGLLRGISVGWNSLSSKYVEEESEDGKTTSYRLHEKSLLLEVSFVTIPANDKGMVQLAAKLNIEESAARHKTEQLEEELQKLPRHSPEDVEKWRSYFEKKQPANRAATKALARFFAVRGEQQPDDEVLAWERMLALLEGPAPLTDGEKEEVKKEVLGQPVTMEQQTTIEVKPEEKEETPPEAAPTPPPPPPAEEAPPPAPKASVRVSLSALKALPQAVLDAARQAQAEALRQGTPVKDVAGVLDALAPRLKQSLLSQ